MALGMTSLVGACRGTFKEVNFCGFLGTGGAGLRDIDDEVESVLVMASLPVSVLSSRLWLLLARTRWSSYWAGEVLVAIAEACRSASSVDAFARLREPGRTIQSGSSLGAKGLAGRCGLGMYPFLDSAKCERAELPWKIKELKSNPRRQ